MHTTQVEQLAREARAKRWRAKIDPATPPRNIPAARRVTVAAVAAWPGPGGTFTKSTPRRGRENTFYTLTGRVSFVKVEPDGDIHVELIDPTRRTSRDVVVEIPAGTRWCGVPTPGVLMVDRQVSLRDARREK